MEIVNLSEPVPPGFRRTFARLGEIVGPLGETTTDTFTRPEKPARLVRVISDARDDPVCVRIVAGAKEMLNGDAVTVMATDLDRLPVVATTVTA